MYVYSCLILFVLLSFFSYSEGSFEFRIFPFMSYLYDLQIVLESLVFLHMIKMSLSLSFLPRAKRLCLLFWSVCAECSWACLSQFIVDSFMLYTLGWRTGPSGIHHFDHLLMSQVFQAVRLSSICSSSCSKLN